MAGLADALKVLLDVPVIALGLALSYFLLTYVQPVLLDSMVAYLSYLSLYNSPSLAFTNWVEDGHLLSSLLAILAGFVGSLYYVGFVVARFYQRFGGPSNPFMRAWLSLPRLAVAVLFLSALYSLLYLVSFLLPAPFSALVAILFALSVLALSFPIVGAFAIEDGKGRHILREALLAVRFNGAYLYFLAVIYVVVAFFASAYLPPLISYFLSFSLFGAFSALSYLRYRR